MVRAVVRVWRYVAALFVALSLAITILCGSIGGPASGGGKGWERSRRVLAKSVCGCNSAISGQIESLWHWGAVQVGLTALGNPEIAGVRAGRRQRFRKVLLRFAWRVYDRHWSERLGVPKYKHWYFAARVRDVSQLRTTNTKRLRCEGTGANTARVKILAEGKRHEFALKSGLSLVLPGSGTAGDRSVRLSYLSRK